MSTQVGGNGTTVNTVNATATNNPLKAYLGYSDTSNNPIADGDTSGDLSQHTRNLNLAIGTTGGLLATHSSGNNLNSNELNIYIATSCPDSTNWVAATNGRVKITFPAAGQNQAAVWVNLEGGGVYCENA